MHETTSNQHKIVTYIKGNPVMVVGTISKDGSPHGAAVYVCTTSSEQVYFVTKTETQKFKNIENNPHVSVTIVNPADNSTLQAVGRAYVEDNAQTIEMIMGKMAEIYAHSSDWLPPLAKLRAGPYQVVGIKLKHVRLAHFQGEHAGSERIFKEG